MVEPIMCKENFNFLSGLKINLDSIFEKQSLIYNNIIKQRKFTFWVCE